MGRLHWGSLLIGVAVVLVLQMVLSKRKASA